MTEPTTEGNPVEINIIDLQNILRIVDVAAERGAFRGEELTAVGTVRDKLATFLASIPKPESAAEEAAPEEAPAPAKPARKGRS